MNNWQLDDYLDSDIVFDFHFWEVPSQKNPPNSLRPDDSFSDSFDDVNYVSALFSDHLVVPIQSLTDLNLYLELLEPKLHT